MASMRFAAAFDLQRPTSTRVARALPRPGLRPVPHPDRVYDGWLCVARCLVQHEQRLSEAGMAPAELASVREGLALVLRGARGREARSSALDRLRMLARRDGGLARTALDLAESLD